ncbi:transposase domain-containing protein, partial [Amedibacillus sp. YH-ame6]
WLFTNTKSGAKMSSIYYSLIESAKLNNLDIHGYLEYILEEIKNSETIDIQALLPYSPTIPQRLKIK